VERDTSSDRGGDQAVWQDLVARLVLPQVTDAGEVPWPDRENLTPREDPQGGEDFDVPVSRRRVIKPANFLRLAEDAARHDGSQDHDDQQADGNYRAANHGAANDGAANHGSAKDGQSRGLDFQDLADLEFDDEDDEHYIPPEIPPQPKLDPVAKGAWIALFGGPGYLFLATTLSWQVPGWAELAAIIAFIAGFVVLVFRLGDGPSRKDGPDQGAVV
jgi:hypothetical protein